MMPSLIQPKVLTALKRHGQEGVIVAARTFASAVLKMDPSGQAMLALFFWVAGKKMGKPHLRRNTGKTKKRSLKNGIRAR